MAAPVSGTEVRVDGKVKIDRIQKGKKNLLPGNRTGGHTQRLWTDSDLDITILILLS
jgi:hypothetical protein